jgi:hypothetical protein
MIQTVKPRCRIAVGEDGSAAGWLVHGLGVNVYSITSIDHALGYWNDGLMRKILERGPETENDARRN